MWGRPQGVLVITSNRTESVEHSPQRDIKKVSSSVVRCQPFEHVHSDLFFERCFFEESLISNRLAIFHERSEFRFLAMRSWRSRFVLSGATFLCLGFLWRGAS